MIGLKSKLAITFDGCIIVREDCTPITTSYVYISLYVTSQLGTWKYTSSTTSCQFDGGILEVECMAFGVVADLACDAIDDREILAVGRGDPHTCYREVVARLC